MISENIWTPVARLMVIGDVKFRTVHPTEVLQQGFDKDMAQERARVVTEDKVINTAYGPSWSSRNHKPDAKFQPNGMGRCFGDRRSFLNTNMSSFVLLGSATRLNSIPIVERRDCARRCHLRSSEQLSGGLCAVCLVPFHVIAALDPSQYTANWDSVVGNPSGTPPWSNKSCMG